MLYLLFELYYLPRNNNTVYVDGNQKKLFLHNSVDTRKQDFLPPALSLNRYRRLMII